jgi:hypothetical protein
MLVQPKTEEQFAAEEAERLEQYKPWPAGTICDYEVLTAVETESKSGKPMIKAEVRLFNSEGKTKDITEYLGSWNEYKLSRIAPDRYEAGQVDDYDLVGRTGKCKLGIQIGGFKDDGTRYADKNEVREYLKPAQPVQKSIKALDDELNDELSF